MDKQLATHLLSVHGETGTLITATIAINSYGIIGSCAVFLDNCVPDKLCSLHILSVFVKIATLFVLPRV